MVSIFPSSIPEERIILMDYMSLISCAVEPAPDTKVNIFLVRKHAIREPL